MQFVVNPVRVEAHVIKRLGPHQEDGSFLVFTDHDGAEVEEVVTFEMAARYVPVPGDYFVTQSDGYEYVNPKDVFERKYSPVTPDTDGVKTLDISDIKGARANIKDIVVFGNGDTFKLLCKASSKSQGWMKSTKAMEITGYGCIVQSSTQQGDNVAEALVFVPNVHIVDDEYGGRKLETINNSFRDGTH